MHGVECALSLSEMPSCGEHVAGLGGVFAPSQLPGDLGVLYEAYGVGLEVSARVCWACIHVEFRDFGSPVILG